MKWNQTVGTEGGPILVADPADIVNWRGAIYEDGGDQGDYDAACELLDETEVANWDLGERSGMLWEVEGGAVLEVGVSESRDQIVVFQIWPSGHGDNEEQEMLEVRKTLSSPKEDEQDTGKEVSFPSGVAVLLWAPTGFAHLEGVHSADDLAGLPQNNDQPVELSDGGINGLGTVLAVQPGAYNATIGRCEDVDDENKPDYRWIRLSLK